MLNEPENGNPVRQERYSGLTDTEVQAGAQLTTAALSLIKVNPSKQELKAHCGRKPIFKKKKQKWQECADDYTKAKMQALVPKASKVERVAVPVKSWYATPAGIGGITFGAVALIAGTIYLIKKFS